ncbi:hypothetical protein QR680_010093 [Steinernema hermaphroditum]|uniref:Uncharacterized protein n=1 Tax=Steinernema hermaphroditum TaxID=289476 RepID=A0AA39MB30_9BILA|nr:hypothetical protein QR680_010093 [Steinernema hermaphroditum]
MPLLPPSVFYIVAAPCSAVALILNLRLLIIYLYSKNQDKKHYLTLFLTLSLHILFDISSLVYAPYCLIGMFQSAWNPSLVFWSGSVTFASVTAIIACNCCITLDRIFAMRKPIVYAIRYSRPCGILTVVLMAASFSVAFVRHYIGFIPPLSSQPSFLNVMSPDIMRSSALIKTVMSFVNLGFTLLFLREMRLFLRNLQSTQIHQNIKSANQVIILQVSVEALFMIFPDVVAVPLSYYGISLPQIIGSFPATLSSAYTLVCALLMTGKLRKDRMLQNISTVAVKSV